MVLKNLLPSLKEKKRYVAFEVISDTKPNYVDTTKAIIENYKKYFGLIGMAKSDLIILDDWKNQKGIIKINNKHTDELKMSLALLKNINNHNVIVRCLGISGIVNKARERYLN
ncbi:MAG: Rpp14/Pop5 family protein [Candidatus Nanoarchaeia archaeon]|nr:Rpp14/Pop5 family protein [Candidatus Nanoarchaeia archaeon]